MSDKVNTSALSVDPAKVAQEKDNRQTMIEVDHVSMVFNMASEQLNSLKEYAIKIAKRELFFEGLTALDDVSFEVKKGDVFGILGTNGSGKSTMMKIIAGVMDPTKGSCTINGNIAPLIELGAGFDLDLSARENIYLNGALLGYSKPFIDEHFDQIVDFAEIEQFLDMPLKNYSSGMVARIAFAIATVIIPDILLVDEVLSVGDFMFQKKCENRIKELIEEHGVTVLIVSHSNDQIARLCNKAIWIEKGHTRLIGDAKTVSTIYGSLAGRTGSTQSEQRVLDIVESIINEETPDNFEIISGQNPIGTNTKVVQQCNFDKAETVVLVCDDTHINAVLAHPLSSALSAPILVTKPNGLSDLVERYLIDFNPSSIILIDYGCNATQVVDQLNLLLPNATKNHLHHTGNGIFDFSFSVFKYGLERNLWKTSLAFIDFDDNPESLAATAFLNAAACPVLITRDQDYDRKILEETLEATTIANFFVIGKTAGKLDLPFFHGAAKKNVSVTLLSDSEIGKSCLKICEFTSNYFLKNNGSSTDLLVSALSLSQWPELLSCGQFAAKIHAAILLVDESNLDSIAACLDYVSQNENTIDKLYFIGGDSTINATEREMFSHVLAGR